MCMHNLSVFILWVCWYDHVVMSLATRLNSDHTGCVFLKLICKLSAHNDFPVQISILRYYLGTLRPIIIGTDKWQKHGSYSFYLWRKKNTTHSRLRLLYGYRLILLMFMHTNRLFCFYFNELNSFFFVYR